MISATRAPFALSVALAAVLTTALAADAQAAKIKCWKNDDGVRECGNSVPPKYAQQGHEVKSKGGLTVDRTSKARDAEEARKARLAKIEAQRAARKDEERRRKQAVKDRVLLDSFASEQDVKLQHSGKMDAIDSRINHSREHITKLEETLGAMQKLAADDERAGKKVSEETLSDIADVQRQIEETERFIEQRKTEQKVLTRQYEENLDRFRFLKSGGSIGSPPKKS